VTPGRMNVLLIDRRCSRGRGLCHVPIQRALCASTPNANRVSSFYLLCTSSTASVALWSEFLATDPEIPA
jgi:hypothetical protein